jgi:hypothetical protein
MMRRLMVMAVLLWAAAAPEAAWTQQCGAPAPTQAVQSLPFGDSNTVTEIVGLQLGNWSYTVTFRSSDLTFTEVFPDGQVTLPLGFGPDDVPTSIIPAINNALNTANVHYAVVSDRQ